MADISEFLEDGKITSDATRNVDKSAKPVDLSTGPKPKPNNSRDPELMAIPEDEQAEFEAKMDQYLLGNEIPSILMNHDQKESDKSDSESSRSSI